MIPCHLEPFDGYAEALPRLLDAIDAGPVLARQEKILIKPNLVNASAPPVTLPAEAVMVLVRWLQHQTKARIIIGEGSGDMLLSTIQVYDRLGYFEMAEKYDVKLLDLNQAPLVFHERPECQVFPEIWLPQLLQECFVISFAVLKAHSLAGVTLSMKNMIGCAPPSHYQQGGHWKKSFFHRQMQRSTFELNLHRKPDLALIDASVGLAEHHLGGNLCNPAPEKLIGGFDPVAVDAAGARLLGQDWQQIEHIRWAHGVLGDADAGIAAVQNQPHLN